MYIDTYFQSGHCSTNHDGVAIEILEEIVPMIRENLGEDIQVIVRMDGGYYDQKIFAACDALKINFICAGKRYSDHKIHANTKLENFDGVYRKKACTWHYLTFQERRKSWPKEMAYRALFLRPTEENGEALLGLESFFTFLPNSLASVLLGFTKGFFGSLAGCDSLSSIAFSLSSTSSSLMFNSLSLIV